MQLDAQKLLEFCQNVHVVWSGLFQIVGFTTLLVYTIGPSTFVGIFLLIALIPVQFTMYGVLSKYRKQLNKTTDGMILQIFMCQDLIPSKNSCSSTHHPTQPSHRILPATHHDAFRREDQAY